jgi:hypothetical protein
MNKRLIYLIFFLSAVAIASGTACPTRSPRNLGDVAQKIACEFPKIDQFIIAIAYLSGIGFGLASIFKFKQVKDNPTQIPISTPFSLLAVSTLLVFMPGVIKPAGASFFGESGVSSSSDTSGPDGSGGTLMPFQ